MSDTRTRILDLANQLTQSRGFNGFSYLDLAAEIGIKNSSIHYHFKAKSDLALAMVEQHRKTTADSFAQLDHQFARPQDRLTAVIQHFQADLRDGKICLCGMMAAEFQSISVDVRRELALYFRGFQDWLSKQFSELGHQNPPRAALQFLSALEGSLLLARLQGDVTIVSQALDGFVNG
ncbi:TetR/AcrR family transcriptional regulator [Octadecabacter sp. G9-8]|uniref:TetR/AcrR family transcriptional regulator n=1 Tax=Octadecabacter dasysiphoniae TaxID=2909341 RepID=A0ABS9CQG2_9RHOB|nr:TetR/AcrR family transcriptional regulator [Octadecabacter dasysiphoniae]MCF2869480.1 TetR/AcrR family transcriptional regulator [Octadecabacter dasysiphoniae]